MANYRKFFFIILFFLFHVYGYTAMPRVAICYWGLTRSVKWVYPSHYDKLFNVLKAHHIPYDIFMHTWHTNAKQRIQRKEIDIPIDYEEYKLLNPMYYRIDDQDAFTEALQFNNYFYQDIWNQKGDRLDGEWPPKLILNHLCALESQKRVTDMVLESNNEYDLIMYIRPDANLSKAFPIKILLNINEGDIIIPNFDHGEGYNDRFAILSYATAPIYGKRIDNIIEFRRTKGRIVSEKYVKYICDSEHLNVILIDFFFNLVRPHLN